MKRLVLLAGAALLAASASAQADGDAAAGEKVFRKCMACHAVGEGAKNKVGPHLNGVVDAAWGHVDDFKYSKPLLDGKDAGKVWDNETLHAYLTNPKDVIPKGKMAFAGLKKEDERADVIAYLAQFALDGSKQ